METYCNILYELFQHSFSWQRCHITTFHVVTGFDDCCSCWDILLYLCAKLCTYTLLCQHVNLPMPCKYVVRFSCHACNYSILPCWYGMTCCYIFCIYDFLIYYFKMNVIAECAILCCTIYIPGYTPHLQVLNRIPVPILNWLIQKYGTSYITYLN
jgi:hypothetical protein